jgi:antitoxin component YwqK of YwqJK toxin-antitoxin module
MIKAILYIPLLTFLLLISALGYSQVKRGDTREFRAVFDSTYGINIYEALNMNTGGDSTRNDVKGYALQGWLEDYYPDEKVLHKGYYIDGQLKAYKNYYPNGQLEREFRMMDLSKSGLSIYYEDGKTKSLITYITKNAVKEEDYFRNGQLEYIEEYDKRAVYYLQRKFYNLEGKPTSTLEIIDTKKLIYNSKEYYDNGNVKEEGQVIFNESMGDYQKNGKWKFYLESGAVKEEKVFSKDSEGE